MVHDVAGDSNDAATTDGRGPRTPDAACVEVFADVIGETIRAGFGTDRSVGPDVATGDPTMSGDLTDES